MFTSTQSLYSEPLPKVYILHPHHHQEFISWTLTIILGLYGGPSASPPPRVYILNPHPNPEFISWTLERVYIPSPLYHLYPEPASQPEFISWILTENLYPEPSSSPRVYILNHHHPAEFISWTIIIPQSLYLQAFIITQYLYLEPSLSYRVHFLKPSSSPRVYILNSH